jgi:hypothetical protein
MINIRILSGRNRVSNISYFPILVFSCSRVFMFSSHFISHLNSVHTDDNSALLLTSSLSLALSYPSSTQIGRWLAQVRLLIHQL